MVRIARKGLCHLLSRLVPMHLVLGDAAVGPWRDAGGAVKDLCRGRSGRAAHADVGVVQEERHVIPHKVQEPHGPEVEAAQRLQRQARQGGALQLACNQCTLNCTSINVLGCSQWQRCW